MRSAQFSSCCKRQSRTAGSRFVTSFKHLAALPPQCGGIAQLVERLLCKQNVRSSSLLTSTNFSESLIGPVAQLVRACA